MWAVYWIAISLGAFTGIFRCDTLRMCLAAKCVAFRPEIIYINYVLTTVEERGRSGIYLFTDKLDRSFFLPCLKYVSFTK